jgi:hypothetical protein
MFLLIPHSNQRNILLVCALHTIARFCSLSNPITCYMCIIGQWLNTANYNGITSLIEIETESGVPNATIARCKCEMMINKLRPCTIITPILLTNQSISISCINAVKRRVFIFKYLCIKICTLCNNTILHCIYQLPSRSYR